MKDDTRQQFELMRAEMAAMLAIAERHEDYLLAAKLADVEAHLSDRYQT